MSLAHASPRRRPCARATVSVAVLLATLLATTLTGCSAAGDAPDGDRRDRAGQLTDAATELEVKTSVARVHGELAPAQRKRLEREAGRLLGRYLSAAYLRQRPTAGYRTAFPGFTSDARSLALDDVATSADGAYTWATDRRPVGALAFLSVVAPKGRPAGATARVWLKLEVSDDRRRREVAVRGRLLLTPEAKRWQIFGYDLSVALTAMRRSR